METKGIDLTKCHGLRFRAKFSGVETEGIVSVLGDRVYLCHGREKLGYPDRFNREHLTVLRCTDMKSDFITDFEIVPRDPETYSDWQVGDKTERLVEEYDDNKEVIFRSGELVVCKTVEGFASPTYLCDELFKAGYHLVLTDIEKQIIEERKKTEWKPQDGDICYVKGAHGVEWVFIKDAREYKTASYIRVILDNDCLDTVIACEKSIKELRPATDEEKQRLFDAMAKEGKRWNAEKKVVEDIPKPYEFKKGDPVLVKDEGGKWRIGVFVRRENSFYGYRTRPADGIGEIGYHNCIPYNEKTMHLLGTNEDYREE